MASETDFAREGEDMVKGLLNRTAELSLRVSFIPVQQERVSNGAENPFRQPPSTPTRWQHTQPRQLSTQAQAEEALVHPSSGSALSVTQQPGLDGGAAVGRQPAPSRSIYRQQEGEGEQRSTGLAPGRERDEEARYPEDPHNWSGSRAGGGRGDKGRSYSQGQGQAHWLPRAELPDFKGELT